MFKPVPAGRTAKQRMYNRFHIWIKKKLKKVGPQLGQVGPQLGPTAAHLGMLLWMYSPFPLLFTSFYKLLRIHDGIASTPCSYGVVYFHMHGTRKQGNIIPRIVPALIYLNNINVWQGTIGKETVLIKPLKTPWSPTKPHEAPQIPKTQAKGFLGLHMRTFYPNSPLEDILCFISPILTIFRQFCFKN